MHEGCCRHYSHYSKKHHNCIFLCYSHSLHANKHNHTCNHIIQYLCQFQRHIEPVYKYLCAAIYIAAYSRHDSKPVYHKYYPAEHLFHLPVKKFSFKALNQLYAAVIKRQLCYYKVKDYIYRICNQNHPYNIQKTVLSCQIRHSYNSRSYAVSHYHTYRFCHRKLSF